MTKREPPVRRLDVQRSKRDPMRACAGRDQSARLSNRHGCRKGRAAFGSRLRCRDLRGCLATVVSLDLNRRHGPIRQALFGYTGMAARPSFRREDREPGKKALRDAAPAVSGDRSSRRTRFIVAAGICKWDSSSRRRKTPLFGDEAPVAIGMNDTAPSETE